jgi:hypothetical protein
MRWPGRLPVTLGPGYGGASTAAVGIAAPLAVGLYPLYGLLKLQRRVTFHRILDRIEVIKVWNSAGLAEPSSATSQRAVAISACRSFFGLIIRGNRCGRSRLEEPAGYFFRVSRRLSAAVAGDVGWLIRGEAGSIAGRA